MNNPVAFSDEEGTATKSCLDHSTEPRTPWKNSGSGGGRAYKDYRSGVDYGDVADKFYIVRLFKFIAGDPIEAGDTAATVGSIAATVIGGLTLTGAVVLSPAAEIVIFVIGAASTIWSTGRKIDDWIKG